MLFFHCTNEKVACLILKALNMSRLYELLFSLFSGACPNNFNFTLVIYTVSFSLLNIHSLKRKSAGLNLFSFDLSFPSSDPLLAICPIFSGRFLKILHTIWLCVFLHFWYFPPTMVELWKRSLLLRHVFVAHESYVHNNFESYLNRFIDFF